MADDLQLVTIVGDLEIVTMRAEEEEEGPAKYRYDTVVYRSNSRGRRVYPPVYLKWYRTKRDAACGHRDVVAWAKDYGGLRVMMLKTLVGGLKVSTVRVSDYPDAYPYETTVFRCDSEGYVTGWVYSRRYRNKRDAARGHRAVVAYSDQWEADDALGVPHPRPTVR